MPTYATARLAARARALAADAPPGVRPVLGLAGPPGAGKSTLAEALVEELGPAEAALVPMDGFHLAESELRRLDRLARKGAPDTFDAHGYLALLSRLRAPARGETVYAPTFARSLEEPVAGSIPVRPEVPLVVTEGNYLLLDRPPWNAVRPLLAECWWIDLPDPERLRRLVARHRRFGRSAVEAEEFVHASDEANARLVAAESGAADLVVTAPPR